MPYSSKYENPISDTKLMWLKAKMKNKTKCVNGHEFDTRIKSHGKLIRSCSLCLKASKLRATKKYLEKKQKEKSESFKVHF